MAQHVLDFVARDHRLTTCIWHLDMLPTNRFQCLNTQKKHVSSCFYQQIEPNFKASKLQSHKQECQWDSTSQYNSILESLKKLTDSNQLSSLFSSHLPRRFTPWKINMEPKHHPVLKRNIIWTIHIHFCVPSVNFPGCVSKISWPINHPDSQPDIKRISS